MELGLFDPPHIQPYTKIPPQAVNSKEHQVNLHITCSACVHTYITYSTYIYSNNKHVVCMHRTCTYFLNICA